MRAAEGPGSMVSSEGADTEGTSSPQCPWEVYSQRQTSVAMKREGKSLRRALMARMTGPEGSSAGVPRPSYSSEFV